MREANEELAHLEVLDVGKLYTEAKTADVPSGTKAFDFFAAAITTQTGDFNKWDGAISYTRRVPLGVCAGIGAWNYPMQIACWKSAPALAAGNAFILKPSERDPSVVMFYAKLMTQAGFPDGVFNVINGDKEAVDALINNKDVVAMSFVGSTPIAKYIYENAAKNEKRVQALGGAKNHLVVMPDCDIDGAVNGLMGAAYGSAGERCMAQSVAVAVGNIGDELVSRLSSRGTESRTRHG